MTGKMDKDYRGYINRDGGIFIQHQQICGREARMWGQQKRCFIMRYTEDNNRKIFA